MTDQQMHERLQAAGARWREHSPLAVGEFEPQQRHHSSAGKHPVTWLLTAAAVLAAAVGITIPLLTGGDGGTQVPAAPVHSLYGVRWIWSESDLEGVGPLKLPRTTRHAHPELAALRFMPAGSVRGNDGCNALSGRALVRGEQVKFGRLGDLQACRGNAQEISGSIDRILRGNVSWSIACDRLTLTGPDGTLTYDAPQRDAAPCSHRAGATAVK